MSPSRVGGTPTALRRLLRRAAAPAAVLAGGLVGSALRASVALALPAAPDGFPVSTLTVNLLGALLLGFYLARRQRATVSRWSLQFWAIGGLGSFTTFSTFSVEVVRLLDAGRSGVALVYVGISLVFGLAAAVIGDRIGAAGW